MGTVNLVWAREPIPPRTSATPSVFLAGPTPVAGSGTPSWRPQALQILTQAWDGARPLTVFTPESRDSVRAVRYEDQFAWENLARRRAGAIMFWIPRDLATLPGFTTNVEFGHDVTTGRAVLGCPPDCPNPERNRYLIHLAHSYGVPVRSTLAETVTAALAIAQRTDVSHPCG
ncbi:hypothetical protein GCM10022226_06760 [Sphaerisporangium flaviroseum]|uniref:Nucleoside 2-deoxyribosyltransferase n=1 Tax=Sphaerisporangium flaviroseum TaxID=509199 RepID=A0ABP7HEE3_9ACTN